MGVPKFFRWISERYPLINQPVGVGLAPEFDCLYLDMNGIVHNCSHGTSKIAYNLTESEMFLRIFQYIDKLFNIVKPKKLIYLAIDGVAPRAKMNQQRQRRFFSANEQQKAHEEAIRNNLPIDEDPFDTNCITPGTPFMEKLSAHIQYFIRSKIRDDPEWQNIKVIFSGAESVGEGEHKIMSYIRSQRMQPDYDPNMRHVFYGLDADLIMLSLLSHEHNMCLLREEVLTVQKFGVKRKTLVKPDEFHFLHLSVFREYIEAEFKSVKFTGNVKFDLERVIDDIVFMFYLVGNDFLPGIPSIDIADGGLHELLDIYKKILPKHGYFTHWGTPILTSFQHLLKELAKNETAMFAKIAAQLSRRGISEAQEPEYISERAATYKTQSVGEFLTKDEIDFINDDNTFFDLDDLEEIPLEQYDNVDEDTLTSDLNPRNYYRRKFPEFYPNTVANANSTEDIQNRDVEQNILELTRSYFEGLCWCYKYYYAGVQSWKWHYEYKFAPLVSSLAEYDVSTLKFDFSLGQPFNPFEQLMGVLPPKSSKLLPPAYRHLFDSTSPIKDFYPDEFEVDMNGKYNAWEGVAMIPFINEERLLAAIHQIPLDKLTESEKLRNVNAQCDLLFVHDKSVKEVYSLASGYTTTITLVSQHPEDVNGQTLTVSPKDPSREVDMQFPDLADCQSRVIGYINPPIPRTPHFADEHMKEVLTILDNHDSTLYNVHYGHADIENNTARLCGEGRYLPVALPNAIRYMPGTPVLAALENANVRVEPFKTNVFGRATNHNSVVLVPSSEVNTRANRLQTMLQYVKPGDIVYFDYPYLRQGLVSRIQDSTTVVTMENNRQVSRGSTHAELNQFKIAQQHTLTKLRSNQAIDVVHMEVIVFIRPLVGMGITADGQEYQSFAPEDYSNYDDMYALKKNPYNYDNTSTEVGSVPVKVTACCGQLLWKDHPMGVVDERFVPKAPKPVEDRYPIGSEVVYIGSGLYGAVGKVTQHIDDTKAMVTFTSKPLDIGTQLRDYIKQNEQKYYTPTEASAIVGINPLIIARITGSLLLLPGKVDIGLALKFPQYALCIPDYIRRVDGWHGNNSQWLVSERTLVILRAFKERFGLLVDYMGKMPTNDTFDVTKMLNNPQKAKVYIEDVKKFLNELATSKLIAIPCSSIVADSILCSSVEQTAITFSTQLKEHTVFTETHTVEYAHLYNANCIPKWSPTSPLLANQHGSTTMLNGRSLSQKDVSEMYKYELGDRVLSLRSDEGVTVGAAGTVVGIHGSFLEIIFDDTYLTCTNLHDKLTTNRGKLLSVYSVLNITTPKPVDVVTNTVKIVNPATTTTQTAVERDEASKRKKQYTKAIHENTPVVANNTNNTKGKGKNANNNTKQQQQQQQQPKQSAKQTGKQQTPAPAHTKVDPSQVYKTEPMKKPQQQAASKPKNKKDSAPAAKPQQAAKSEPEDEILGDLEQVLSSITF